MNTRTTDNIHDKVPPAEANASASIVDDTPPPDVLSVLPATKWHVVRSGEIWCACPKTFMSLAAWKMWAAAFTPNQLWDDKCAHCQQMLKSGNTLIAIMTDGPALFGLELRQDSVVEMVHLNPESPLFSQLARAGL